jgi:hypothetical protein
MKQDTEEKKYCDDLLRYKDPEKQLAYIRDWKKNNPVRVAESNKRSNQRAKEEALSHYGKNGVMQCCWDGCEITDPDMLTLDHIENDGAEHRGGGRSCGTTGVDMYRRLRAAGWPAGLQTLCWNHQWKKEITRRNQASELRLQEKSKAASAEQE